MWGFGWKKSLERPLCMEKVKRQSACSNTMNYISQSGHITSHYDEAPRPNYTAYMGQ